MMNDARHFFFFLPNVFAQSSTQWDLPEGAKVRKGSAGGLKFSADGNRLMVRNFVGIWVYDAHSGVELDLLADNLSDYLAVSPDGGTVAGWGPDDKVCLWNVTDSENNTFAVDRIAYRRGGKTVVKASTAS